MSIPRIQAYGLVDFEGPIVGKYFTDTVSKCDKYGYALRWAGYYFVKKERTVPVVVKSRIMYYDVRVYNKLCEILNVPNDGMFRVIFVRDSDSDNVCVCTCKFNNRSVMDLAEKADSIIRKSKDCGESESDDLWRSIDGTHMDLDKATVLSLIPLR